MASKNIRGITIEIGGDTTKLGKALEDSEKKSRSLQVELREIEKALKFDPTNVELLAQKQTVLTNNISETSKKLDTLKEAERQVIAQFERGEVAEEQVRALQREIINTERSLEGMRSELTSTNSVMDNLANGTNDAEEHIDDLADSANTASDEMVDFKEKASEAFDVVATGALAIGASAGAVAGYAVNLSTEFDKAFNTLQTQTGATVEEMKELDESMTNIYKNNFGESMEDVAQSLATVQTQTDLTGKELEEVTQTALLMRDVFGWEVNESIRGVNSMMKQFGITADEAYTLIAQGAQNGLNQNDDLMDVINEYSVQFSMLGYDAEEMFNMLVNGANEGTWSIDKLGDAVKEFTIRTKDGSESTSDAFQWLGLTANGNEEALSKLYEELNKYEEKMGDLDRKLKYANIEQSNFTDKTSELTKIKMADNIALWTRELEELEREYALTEDAIENLNNTTTEGKYSTQELFDMFAKGGDSAKQATEEVMTALFAMEDKVLQDATGVALFGTMWEDLGADAIKALMDTQGELSLTSDALNSLNEVKYDDIGSALGGLKRTLETDIIDPLGDELKPLVEEAITYVQENAPAIKETLAGITKAIGSFVKLIVDNADVIVSTIVAIGAGFVAWNVVTMIQGVVGAITAFKLANEGATIAQMALNLAMNANPIGIIVTLIAGLVAGFIALWNTSDEFRGFWIGLWETIKNAVSTAIEWIKGVFDIVIEFFQNNWQSILLFLVNPFAGAFTFLYQNFEGFRNFVNTIVSAIKDFFAGLWAKIVEIFTPMVTWFSSLFTSIYNTLSSIVAVIIGLLKGCWILITTIFGIAYEWFYNTVILPIQNAFTNVWTMITDLASNAWNNIVSVWTVVSTWFNDTIIAPISNYFANMWDSLISGASRAWEGITSVFSVVTSWFSDKFSKAWGAVKNIFSTGGKIFTGITEGITSAFKRVVNGIIGGINRVVAVPFNAINGALNTLRKASIAGVSPFAGLPSISVPQIPLLYRGGILKKGQMGLLEGDGAEAVVPLEKETGWINRIAQKMTELQDNSLGLDSIALSSKMDEMIDTIKTLKSTIVLDTGVLVGETINQIDEGLGNNYSLRERRV